MNPGACTLEPEPSKRFVIRTTGGSLRTDGPAEAFLGYTFASESNPQDGIWVKWSWDGRRFVLTNDRLGFRPLFYFATSTAFGVATRISDLLAAGAPVDLDDAAIAVFLRRGFFLGDDTPFRHIRSVPPDVRMTWTDGALRIEPLHRLRAPAASGLSRRSAADAYGERFARVIEQLLQLENGSIGLPLSGGRDSRHILLALAAAGRPPDACVTVAKAQAALDPEARVAAQLCERLGLRHVVLSCTADRLDAELAKNTLTSFCADEHTWLLGVREFFREAPVRAVFDGIGGDVLSAGLFLSKPVLEIYESGDYERLAAHLLGGEGYLAKLLRPDLYRRWHRGLAVERLAAELARHANAPNPVAQFFFWNRTRREISLAPWGVLGDPPKVFAPYLAADIYDLLSGLPAEYFLDHSFHSEVIERCYPRFGSVPYAGEPPLGSERKSSLSARLRFVRGLLGLRQSRRRGCCVAMEFLLPRLACYLVRPGESSRFGHSFAMSAYLMQLDAIAHRGP